MRIRKTEGNKDMKKKSSASDTEKPVRENVYPLYDQGEYRFDIVVKGEGDQKTAELRVIKKIKRANFRLMCKKGTAILPQICRNKI